MTPGRKVKNLRLDRGLSAQDLAEASGISPGSLSKIERGVNAPRGQLLLRLARRLSVPCEYLLDESMPYPYEPPNWRDELHKSGVDPKAKVHMVVTCEEKAFLLALRRSHKLAREIAYAVPELSLEKMYVAHRIVAAKAPPMAPSPSSLAKAW